MPGEPSMWKRRYAINICNEEGLKLLPPSSRLPVPL